MNIKAKIVLLLLFYFNMTLLFAQVNEWDLKKDENGIAIYTREDENSGNIEFKAIIILKTNIDKLLKVFLEVDNYTDWMADMKVSKTLNMISDTSRYIYYEAQVPWPLENRDLPVYLQITKSEKVTKISLEGKPNFIPNKEGITRIEEAIGSWKFTDKTNNKVEVIYQFLADPGLNIPNWIIHLFIVDGPYKTLLNLQSIVEH